MRHQAFVFALGRGVRPEIAEEFAQELVAEQLEREGGPYSLEWRLIDYLRREQGSLRCPGQRARLNQVSLDEPPPGTGAEFGETWADVIAAPEPEAAIVDIRERFERARAKAQLNAREDAVIEALLDGVERKELAAELGVTTARVSQIISSARLKIVMVDGAA